MLNKMFKEILGLFALERTVGHLPCGFVLVVYLRNCTDSVHLLYLYLLVSRSTPLKEQVR
jgi:hypothetical protein